MFSQFLEKFRRVTSGSTAYIPEIDGLRFIAISWVVLLMHLPNIINLNLYGKTRFESSFINNLVLEGGNGVCLFFMISGFILGLPFLKEKLYGEKKVSLKKYYIRRLTRLEPPYIVALLIAFTGLIITGVYTFSGLINNLVASVFYVHNWIYQSHSRVMGVAWSLEVETRFYLLAPFLAYVFLIKKTWLRRGILLIVALALYVKQYYDIWNSASPFINFLGYFLIGMLLADLYLSKWKLSDHPFFYQWFGIALFIGMHFMFSTNNIFLFFLKMISMAVFFYIGITNEWWKKILRIQWIAIIGGMCYSIYLMHLMTMSVITRVLQEFPINNKIIGFLVYGCILITGVMIVSMLFYRFIEQPCMRRDWYKRKKTS